VIQTIPAELRALDQWVVWRREVVNGRKTKVPYQAAAPDSRASSTDARTWASFDVAVDAVGRGLAAGVGFVFTASDPFCGIDLDETTDESQRIIDLLASYTELSLSFGAHVIVRAELPDGARHRNGGLELYDRGRFFVMTGAHIGGTPPTIEERQGEVERVLAEYLPGRTPTPRRAQPLDLDDRDLLERAYAARNGDALRRLYEGDTAGYPSASEADLALCARLAFWTGRDAARIDSLFRGSALMRAKWERADYREATITRAIG
jgi:primase-polymerase (primpol)-like protein